MCVFRFRWVDIALCTCVLKVMYLCLVHLIVSTVCFLYSCIFCQMISNASRCIYSVFRSVLHFCQMISNTSGCIYSIFLSVLNFLSNDFKYIWLYLFYISFSPAFLSNDFRKTWFRIYIILDDWYHRIYSRPTPLGRICNATWLNVFEFVTIWHPQ